MDDYSEGTVKLNRLQKLLEKAFLHEQYDEAFAITNQIAEVLIELQEWIIKNKDCK